MFKRLSAAWLPLFSLGQNYITGPSWGFQFLIFSSISHFISHTIVWFHHYCRLDGPGLQFPHVQMALLWVAMVRQSERDSRIVRSLIWDVTRGWRLITHKIQDGVMVLHGEQRNLSEASVHYKEKNAALWWWCKRTLYMFCFFMPTYKYFRYKEIF